MVLCQNRLDGTPTTYAHLKIRNMWPAWRPETPIITASHDITVGAWRLALLRPTGVLPAGDIGCFNLLVLNVGNGWEWGNGIIIAIMDHSHPFPTSSTSELNMTWLFDRKMSKMQLESKWFVYPPTTILHTKASAAKGVESAMNRLFLHSKWCSQTQNQESRS